MDMGPASPGFFTPGSCISSIRWGIWEGELGNFHFSIVFYIAGNFFHVSTFPNFISVSNLCPYTPDFPSLPVNPLKVRSVLQLCIIFYTVPIPGYPYKKEAAR